MLLLASLLTQLARHYFWYRDDGEFVNDDDIADYDDVYDDGTGDDNNDNDEFVNDDPPLEALLLSGFQLVIAS